MGFYLNAKSIQLVGALTPPPKKKTQKKKQNQKKTNKQTKTSFSFRDRVLYIDSPC